jgi:hypothetical protein
MGIYKTLAVSILLGCLIFSQSGLAAENDCLALKSKYALKGEIKPVSSFEKEILYLNLNEILNMLETRASLKVIDVEKLKNEILTVNLCVNISNEALVGSGSRKGSVYFRKEHTIVFNSKKLFSHKNSPGTALTMLHEFLGALGYPDQNYEISSYLYSAIHVASFGEDTLSVIEKAESEYLKNSSPMTENITYAMSGGVTGVGGGGDIEVVLLKALALNCAIINIDYFEKILKAQLPSDQFAQFIMKYKIETDDVNKFANTYKSGYPFLSYALMGKEMGIVVEAGEWSRMLDAGTSAFDERTKLVQNLVMLMGIGFGRSTHEK